LYHYTKNEKLIKILAAATEPDKGTPAAVVWEKKVLLCFNISDYSSRRKKGYLGLIINTVEQMLKELPFI